MSLISPNETLQIAGILTGLAAFGFWVETTAIGRKASGVLIILCLGVLLSNIQIIPPQCRRLWCRGLDACTSCYSYVVVSCGSKAGIR